MIHLGNKFNFKDRSGQAMLEMVVAISVILVGVVSTLTLTIATISGGNISKMQVTASNLAREGIEIVRNLRDQNALLIEANELDYTLWTNGLEGGVNAHAAIVDASDWSLDSLNETLEDCIKDNNCRLYLDNDNFFSHHDKTGQATPYWRLVLLHPICMNLADKSYNDEEILEPNKKCADIGADYSQVGIQIISQVQWEEKGRAHNTSLEDRIYNWKW